MALYRLRQVVGKIIDKFSPSWRVNLRNQSRPGLWHGYFDVAEGAMDEQWEEFIWPQIKDFDFTSVLELAPGAGRNTEKLTSLAKSIHAIDLNDYALERCRKRLGDSHNGCTIRYDVNDGTSLPMVADSSITTIYCWDAAVHFDKGIHEKYVAEYARVLKPGGKGFVHHSTLGERADKDIYKNPGWRSNMTRELFREYCGRNGLKVLGQTDILWRESQITDCISVFQK